MKTSHYFERVFVLTYLCDASASTVKTYRISVKKLLDITGDIDVEDLNEISDKLVLELNSTGLKPSTIAKHCRHLNIIFGKSRQKLLKNRTAVLIKNPPYFQPPKYRLKDPKRFTDSDFTALYNAFNYETQYPDYLPTAARPAFWQAIMVFVAFTAIRREAVLGICWNDINLEERYVTIRSEIDKKNKTRYKPITQNVIEHLNRIRTVEWTSLDYVFRWTCGTTSWYKCWHRAEALAGIKMCLHDCKRYSGELAMRAGADILMLKQHRITPMSTRLFGIIAAQQPTRWSKECKFPSSLFLIRNHIRRCWNPLSHYEFTTLITLHPEN